MSIGETIIRIVGVVVFAVGVYFFVSGVVVGGICSAIREKKEKNGQFTEELDYAKTHGQRLHCMECPYCKKKLSRAFYTTSALSYWYPSYCRRFKMQLPLTNPTSANRLRCQSKLPENAMREPLPQLTRWGFDPSRN